jgi:hypothetical protein
MFVTLDPLEELRKTYAEEVATLDRAIAAIRVRVALLDELLADEQARVAHAA